MTRKKTRRKVWKLINPVTMAVDGAALPDAKQLDHLRRAELSAIESFRTGSAVESDHEMMTVLAAISAVMAYEGIGIEVLPVAKRAWEYMAEAEQRFKGTGKFGITGPALQCLRDLYQYHDLQRTSVMRLQYEEAILKAKQLTQNREYRMKVFEGEESGRSEAKV
jgi:hypothetical protein